MWILMGVLMVELMKGKQILGGWFMSYILLYGNYVIAKNKPIKNHRPKTKSPLRLKFKFLIYFIYLTDFFSIICLKKKKN